MKYLRHLSSITFFSALSFMACGSSPDKKEPQAPQSFMPTAETTEEATTSFTPQQTMIEVRGLKCSHSEKRCLKWLDSDTSPEANGGMGPLRCAEFEYPTKCLSKERKELHFWIDKFEYPNLEGSLPEVGATWYEAKAKCESQGKRLCKDYEWEFACEGPEVNPYAYGYKRDENICNIDKPWIDYTKYSKSRWNEIYQAVPSSSESQCKSWAGVINMNGNVDEWVYNVSEKPYKSGSKGGYWGPVRTRCSPITTIHNETFSFYQLGFRCCKDAK